MTPSKLKMPVLLIAGLALFSCKKEQNITSLEESPRSKERAIAAVIPPNYSLSNWMGALSNNISIAQLSIPGTHDSGARTEPISGTAKCQNLSIGEQLSAGVRFLDIRCRHIDNGFAIHHGAIYQNLNFNDVINACIGFLNSNPTETIIMSVKEEHTASNNTRSFEQTFDSYVSQNSSKWDLGTGIPNLGDVRGKIKLLRRFGSGSAKGIDATNWADNTTFSINNSAANLKVQDFYNVNDVNTKWANVETQLNDAHNDNSNRLYLNFCSGYKAGIFGIPNINTVANSVNPKVTTFFNSHTSGKYGVVILDFVDGARSQLIANTNF